MLPIFSTHLIDPLHSRLGSALGRLAVGLVCRLYDVQYSHGKLLLAARVVLDWYGADAGLLHSMHRPDVLG